MFLKIVAMLLLFIGVAVTPVSVNAKSDPGQTLSNLNLRQYVDTPEEILIGIGMIAAAIFFFKPEPKKPKLATARWAGGAEKRAAFRLACKQIRERKRAGLTTWINQPKITGAIENAKISPSPNMVWIPDCQRGTAVTGAPGYGKTFSVIDPMIRAVLEQGFPAIIYDFKFPSQAEGHLGYAKSLGYDVKVFAPGFEGTESCNLVDFLRDADDGETASQIAKVLNKNFSLNGGKGGEDPFWQMSGDQLIRAVIQLAKSTDFPDVLTCAKILSIEPIELIKKVKDCDLSPWIRTAWEQFLSMEQSEKTAASVAATASLMFQSFVSKDILPCLCGESTIPLDLEGKQLLVFGMDQTRRDVVGPIIATVMHMIVVRNIAKQRIDPLALFLDELPTIALPALVNWLNESRSAGFCGVLGFQNLTQLEKAWGKELSRAVLTGCNTKFIFNPGEFETAEYFSKYVGDKEVNYKQKSRSFQSKGNSKSVSEQDRTTKNITPDEFLKLGQGSCVFINPAYGTGNETNIPLKLTIKLSKSELQKDSRSRKGYPAVIARLAKIRKPLVIDKADIQARIVEIERIFSLRKTSSASTLDALVTKAAEPKNLDELLAQIAREFDRDDAQRKVAVGD